MIFKGICLVTNNVPGLVDFYKMVLCVEADGDDEHSELHTGGANIAIFSTNGMERMAPQSMRGAGSGKVTLGFEVNDVDAEFERLKDLNVDFIMLPTAHP